jgi:UDP-N-acetyl-D-mannosaminuronic acid dehydrogenase
MHADSRYDVFIVGGLGHVGLPLGMVLADAGLQVALYDIDEGKRAGIRAGRMPVMERGAEPILKRVIGKSLHLSDALSDVGHSTLVLIAVGTTIDEDLHQKSEPVLNLVEQMTPYLDRGHCVILCGTVYPGMSKCLNDFLKGRGVDVHLAYCPVRIAQGDAIRELHELPQITSGFTETAVRSAKALFKRLGVETILVKVEEAELAKLFTNAWRYIQFAITNQFYMIATQHDADFARIHHAMTYRYPRGQGFPRPGLAAGPCLVKDTLQLATLHGDHFQLGHAAISVNEGLPNFIVQHLRRHFQSDLTGIRVGILGMAFKADIDDVRNSLSYKLANILRSHEALVFCSDEYVKDPAFVRKEELIATCPVVIVGVPHSSYQDLVVPDATHLVDLWGVIRPRSRRSDAGLSGPHTI